MKKYLVFLFASMILNSCDQAGDEIVGSWERINDDKSGMVVTVTKEKDVYIGRISFLTDSNKIDGFELGDVKWKGIEYVENDNYKFQDLWKGLDLNGQIESIGYGEGYIEIQNDKIIIKHTKDNKTGLMQEWKRTILLQ